ncbi:MAG: hypothetical protein ACLFTT_10835 [Candidatus Hydrogenedentota bacterium]
MGPIDTLLKAILTLLEGVFQSVANFLEGLLGQFYVDDDDEPAA